MQPSSEARTPLGSQVIFAFDTHGVCTLSIGDGLAVLGLKPGQLVGQDMFEVYGRDPSALDSLRRTLAGEPVTIERPFQGREISVYYQPSFDENGTVTGVVGVSTDVTDLRRVEREMLAGRRRAGLLSDLSEALTRAVPDVGTLLAVVVRALAEAVGDVAVVWMCAPGTRRPDRSAVWDTVDQRPGSLDRWLDGDGARNSGEEEGATDPGTPSVVELLDAEEHVDGHADLRRRWARRSGVRSVLSVPVRCRGQLLGVVDVGRRTGPDEYSAAERELTTSVAERFGLAVDTAVLLNGQRAAREDLVKFKALADASVDLIAISDQAGATLYLNPQARAAGIDPSAQDVWATAADLVDPDTLAASRSAVEEHGRWTGEATFTLNGRAVTMQADIFRLRHPETGADLGLAWIGHDLTDLRATEQALRAANADLRQFKALVEASPDFIAIAGLDGSVRYVNPPGRRLIGMDPEVDVTTTSIADYLTPEGLEASVQVEQPAVVAQGRWEGESTLRNHRDDSAIPVAIASFLIREPDTGEPFALATVQRDITERRAAESRMRTLAEQREALLQRLVVAQDAERSRIAADVHDDPVQVLAAVDLRLGLLKRQLRERAPDLLETLEPLHASVSGATDRLRALLFDLEPPDLHRGLAAALQRAASEVFETTEVRCTVEADEPEMPDAIRTVAYRIATEALINVRKHAAATTVSLTVRGTADGLEVTIADDGVGIAPDSAQPVPGHRGLVGMQDRAAVAGGSCTVTARPGGGTLVTVWLPGRGSADH